jgi:hypothetical protein
MANYPLQACKNLEAVFAAVGDAESARHFQTRQRQLARQMDQPKLKIGN